LSYSPVKKRLYAVDTIAGKVYAFTSEGALLFSFGGPGEKEGQFNFPTHIVTAPDGRLYVTDSMNFRVQMFDASGTFLSSFGHHGNGSGDFSMPNLSGRFLFTIGGRGTGHGEFWLPSGLFLDGQNKLYVCDTYNQRVQVFHVMGDRDD
jgi:DNA-binding beta-propeller fold protein YncE